MTYEMALIVVAQQQAQAQLIQCLGYIVSSLVFGVPTIVGFVLLYKRGRRIRLAKLAEKKKSRNGLSGLPLFAKTATADC